MNRDGIEGTKSSAIILRFPRRRGRPKSSRPKTDSGTPELVMKRLLGETAEALDLCLERGIISEEQHWCGIHLRWLYTLRHGVPGVRAMDPTHLGGLEHKPDDPEWRGAREQEYHDAIKKLTESGHARMLMSLCIYNERPAFLDRRRPADMKAQKKLSRLAGEVRDGLDLLVTHWGRGPGKPKRK